MWRKVLRVSFFIGAFGFFAWHFGAKLDFDDNRQVSEWLRYRFAREANPLELRALERDGSHYTGTAVTSDGREFRLRIEELSGCLLCEAVWETPSGRERRMVLCGSPTIQRTRPWADWIVGVVLVGCLILLSHMSAARTGHATT